MHNLDMQQKTNYFDLEWSLAIADFKDPWEVFLYQFLHLGNTCFGPRIVAGQVE